MHGQPLHVYNMSLCRRRVNVRSNGNGIKYESGGMYLPGPEAIIVDISYSCILI